MLSFVNLLNFTMYIITRLCGIHNEASVCSVQMSFHGSQADTGFMVQ